MSIDNDVASNDGGLTDKPTASVSMPEDLWQHGDPMFHSGNDLHQEGSFAAGEDGNECDAK